MGAPTHPHQRSSRANQLYLYNGNLTFILMTSNAEQMPMPIKITSIVWANWPIVIKPLVGFLLTSSRRQWQQRTGSGGSTPAGIISARFLSSTVTCRFRISDCILPDNYHETKVIIYNQAE